MKTISWEGSSKSMGLSVGLSLLSSCLVDLESNAVRGGTITWTLAFSKLNGTIMRSGSCSWLIRLMATSGQRWPRCFQGGQTTPLKIIGTRPWKRKTSNSWKYYQVLLYLPRPYHEEENIFPQQNGSGRTSRQNLKRVACFHLRKQRKCHQDKRQEHSA